MRRSRACAPVWRSLLCLRRPARFRRGGVFAGAAAACPRRAAPRPDAQAQELECELRLTHRRGRQAQGKPGQRPHLVYRGQVGVDPKARCVVACLGEQADGYEGDGLSPILDRARFACPELASVGADQGYAAERVWKDARRRRLTAYIPPQRTMLPPAAAEPRTEAEREARAARERCKSKAGIWAHKRRMADAEGVVGELKLRHGLGHARCRGRPLFHIQLLLGCTALNLKRLAKHAPPAAPGVAAAPASEPATTIQPRSSERSSARSLAAPIAPGNYTVWTVAICLN